LLPVTHFKKYFPDQDAVDKSLIFVQVPATAGPLRSVTQEEEPLTIQRIIEIAKIIGNKDKPVITLYNYVERAHIQQFIRGKISTNLEAFQNGSSRMNDYQGISISGGSGTGKTRHGLRRLI